MTPSRPQFSAIIPSFNEALTIDHVIKEVLATPYLGELIVVDDGSTDDTASRLQKYCSNKHFHLIVHEKNKGKGAALKTGLRKAKHEVVLFLDADLQNITPSKISKIVKPVLNDTVDLSRARFERKRGRVTEIAVKPMMRILFPNLHFDQPITGQICGKKAFFSTVQFNTNWGVDIGILLDAIEAGQRIQEVDIGQLEHKHRSLEDHAKMAEQVLETMIKKAGLIQHKYKLVIFTFDQTLLPKDSMSIIWKKLGIYQDVMKSIDLLNDDEISYPEYLLRIAGLYKGKKYSEIVTACDHIKFEPYTLEVLKALRARKFEVAVVTPTVLPIIQNLAEELGITHYEGVELKKTKTNTYTGEITPRSKQLWLNKSIEVAMVEATKRLARKTRVDLQEIAIVANTTMALPIFEKVGLSLAYQPKKSSIKNQADKTITVLAEVLALVE